MVDKFIEGLKIIESKRPEGQTPYHLRAEHDQIWAGSLEWEFSEEEKERLEELGWGADEDADGFYYPV